MKIKLHLIAVAAVTLSGLPVFAQNFYEGKISWISTPPEIVKVSTVRYKKFADAPFVAAPEIIKDKSPVYPFEAARAKIDGIVRVAALIDEKGAVAKIGFMEVDPKGIFEEETVRALREWRFKVEVRDGKPTPYLVDYVFYYNCHQTLWWPPETTGDMVPLPPGDKRPVPISQVAPQYPWEMRTKHITGEVIVEFLVETDGSVQFARAMRQTNEQFGNAAVACVRQWKFKPGKKAGVAVRTRLQVTVAFTLD